MIVIDPLGEANAVTQYPCPHDTSMTPRALEMNDGLVARGKLSRRPVVAMRS